MKQRFIMTETPRGNKSFVASIVVFVVVTILFIGGIGMVTEKNDKHEKEVLYQAVSDDCIRCYCLEGKYPESLEYIIENYGLVYDEDKYFIDYHAEGSNLLPMITIIDREAGE